jgi:hypothetical protein
MISGSERQRTVRKASLLVLTWCAGTTLAVVLALQGVAIVDGQINDERASVDPPVSGQFAPAGVGLAVSEDLVEPAPAAAAAPAPAPASATTAPPPGSLTSDGGAVAEGAKDGLLILGGQGVASTTQATEAPPESAAPRRTNPAPAPPAPPSAAAEAPVATEPPPSDTAPITEPAATDPPTSPSSETTQPRSQPRAPTTRATATTRAGTTRPRTAPTTRSATTRAATTTAPQGTAPEPTDPPTEPSTTTPPTAPPTSAPPETVRVIPSEGGTLTVSVVDGGLSLDLRSPAPGYTVEDLEQRTRQIIVRFRGSKASWRIEVWLTGNGKIIYEIIKERV